MTEIPEEVKKEQKEKEQETLEKETPTPLFEKFVGSVLAPIREFFKGFREKGEEAPPTPAPTPTPPVPPAPREAPPAVPPAVPPTPTEGVRREELESIIRDLENLRRQVEGEVKPGVSDLRNKVEELGQRAVDREYVEQALRKLGEELKGAQASDWEHLSNLANSFDTISTKREEVRRDYRGTREAYETLKELIGSLGLERDKVEYLTYVKEKGVTSEEAIKTKADFEATLYKTREDLEEVESNLTRIKDELEKYLSELDELEKYASKRKEEVENREKELKMRISALAKQVKRYKKTYERLKEAVPLHHEEEEIYSTPSKEKTRKIKDAAKKLNYVARLSGAYDHEMGNVRELREEISKTLQNVEEDLQRVKEYKGKIDSVLGA